MFQKKLSEMTEQERALFRAYGIMRECAYYWHGYNEAAAVAYERAAELLKAGAETNWNYLNEFCEN